MVRKIWENFNISLTWIVRPFGDDSPEINHDSQGSGEQGSVMMKFTQINPWTWIILGMYMAGWWFQTIFIFHFIYGIDNPSQINGFL